MSDYVHKVTPLQDLYDRLRENHLPNSPAWEYKYEHLVLGHKRRAIILYCNPFRRDDKKELFAEIFEIKGKLHLKHPSNGLSPTTVFEALGFAYHCHIQFPILSKNS